MTIEVEPEVIDGLDKSVAVIGIVVAFAATPILRYSDPWSLMSIACWGAIGFGLSFTVRHIPKPWRWGGIGAGCLALLIMAWQAVPFVQSIQVTASANDRRCLAIQRDMLSARRRMSDGPDVFQALGCRPQGTGMIRVKPTDRELKVGHSLVDGGYPNR